MEPVRVNRYNSNTWRMMGRPVPRNEVVFLCQVIVIFAVVIACIVNLSLHRGNTELWIALLSSSLGYMLPNPSMNGKKALDGNNADVTDGLVRPKRDRM